MLATSGRYATWVAVVVLVLAIIGVVSTRHGPVGIGAADPLVLRMPVPRGSVVWLVQGNRSPEGGTHRPALSQNQYALDLASAWPGPVTVVSAAEGMVTLAHQGVDPDDPQAGLGYGNHVKVLHSDGTYTLYAHLDAVKVVPGQRVGSGAALGTMGATGSAGSRHLHFSLHREAPDAPGAAASLPIERLLTIDVTAGEEAFRVMRGDALVLDTEEQFRGHAYASENDARPPLYGVPPADLHSSVRDHGEQTSRWLRARLRLTAIGRERGRGPEWFRAELAALDPSMANHPVLLYLRAVHVELPDDAEAAPRTLQAALAANRLPQHVEPWIPGRVHYRLGQLALHAGDEQAARAHLVQAARLATSQDVLGLARQALERLDHGAQGRPPP